MNSTRKNRNLFPVSLVLAITSLTACSGCGEADTLELAEAKKEPIPEEKVDGGDTMDAAMIQVWDYGVYPTNLGPIEVGPPGHTFLISSFSIHAYHTIRVAGFETIADKIHNEIRVEVNGQWVGSTHDWGTAPDRGLDRLATSVTIIEGQEATFSVFGTVTPDWNYTGDHLTRMTLVWAYLSSSALAKVDPEHDAVERTYTTIESH